LHGWRAGLASGLGAASADGFYGALAALGISALTVLLTNLSIPLRIFGLIMLSVLGWKALRSRPAEQSAQVERALGRLWAFYASTFALTLTNPLTILAFLGIFAGLGAGGGSAQAWVLVLGVFCGSVLWWLLLALGVSLLRERITPAALLWVNRLSGLIILGFAASIGLGLLSG